MAQTQDDQNLQAWKDLISGVGSLGDKAKSVWDYLGNTNVYGNPLNPAPDPSTVPQSPWNPVGAYGADTQGMPPPAPAEVPPQMDLNAMAMGAPPPPQAPPPTLSPPMGSKGGMQQASGPDLSGIKDYLAKLQDRGNKALDLQRAGIAPMEQQLRDFQTMQPQQDLSPTLGLIDSLFGSNLSKSYNAPMSPEQRMKMISDLQAGIQKAKFGLSEQETTMLKDALQGQYHLADIAEHQQNHQMRQQELALQSQQTAAARKDRTDADMLHKYQTDLNHDTSKVRDKLGEVGQAKSALQAATLNPAANNAAPVFIARSVVNRLNERELQAFGGSKSVLDRANAMADELKSGTMSPDNQKYLSDLVDMMEKSTRADLSSRAKGFASQYAKKTGKSLQDAYDDLTGGDNASMYGPMSNDDTKSTLSITPEQAAAELARRRGSR